MIPLQFSLPTTHIIKAVVITCFCLLAACTPTKQDTSGNEAPSQPVFSPEAAEGTFPADDSLALYFQQFGEGETTVVVPSGMYLAEELKPLAEDYHMICYHQRGRGRSGLPKGPEAAGFEWELKDLEALRKAFELEKMALLGHSYAAGVVALYAQRHPERVSRMVLVGAISPRESPYMAIRTATLQQRADSLDRIRFEQLRLSGAEQKDPLGFCREVRRISLKPMMYDMANYDRFKNDICSFPNENSENLNLQFSYLFSSLGGWDWRELIATIQQPMLLIQGAYDPNPMEGAREWARMAGDAKLLIAQEAGHFPYIEMPDLFFGSVKTFLKGQWPAEAQSVR